MQNLKNLFDFKAETEIEFINRITHRFYKNLVMQRTLFPPYWFYQLPWKAGQTLRFVAECVCFCLKFLIATHNYIICIRNVIIVILQLVIISIKNNMAVVAQLLFCNIDDLLVDRSRTANVNAYV